jgi:hypothetical protein
VTPREALCEAQKHGASLSVRGDRLHVEADDPLPPELVDVLRHHKAALLGMLLEPSEDANLQPPADAEQDGRYAPPRSCTDCHLRLWWQRSDSEWVCGVCHPDPHLLRTQRLRAQAECGRSEPTA